SAASMSSLVPSAQVPSTAPVAGFRFSKTAPLLAGTRRPSIRLRVSGVRGASGIGPPGSRFPAPAARATRSRLRDLHCTRNVFSGSLGRPGGSRAAGGPMTTPAPVFDELSRAELLPIALETMHTGHLIDRALMPAVAIAAKSVDAVDDVAIDEWM